jgi:hypothetical protein
MAQNYTGEFNPLGWTDCPICHCYADLGGNCCCNSLTVCACPNCHATIPCSSTCYCQSCWCSNCSSSYYCNDTHNCWSGGGGSSNDCYCPVHYIYYDCSLSCIECYIGNNGGGGGGGGTPPPPPPATTPTSQAATRIIANARITPATVHKDPRGSGDNANARQNLIDAAAGLQASTSSYENAPNPARLVWISLALLTGIETLAVTNPFSISEIVGGSHAPNSSHYNGNSMDVNQVNNESVSKYNISATEDQNFREAAITAGATIVFGPYNDPDGYHQDHYHIQW